MEKIKEGCCPKCGATLRYGVGEVKDDMYFYNVTCSSCKWSGDEWYNLIFTGFTDRDGNEWEVEKIKRKYDDDYIDHCKNDLEKWRKLLADKDNIDCILVLLDDYKKFPTN